MALIVMENARLKANEKKLIEQERKLRSKLKKSHMNKAGERLLDEEKEIELETNIEAEEHEKDDEGNEETESDNAGDSGAESDVTIDGDLSENEITECPEVSVKYFLLLLSRITRPYSIDNLNIFPQTWYLLRYYYQLFHISCLKKGVKCMQSFARCFFGTHFIQRRLLFIAFVLPTRLFQILSILPLSTPYHLLRQFISQNFLLFTPPPP